MSPSTETEEPSPDDRPDRSKQLFARLRLLFEISASANALLRAMARASSEDERSARLRLSRREAALREFDSTSVGGPR